MLFPSALPLRDKPDEIDQNRLLIILMIHENSKISKGKVGVWKERASTGFLQKNAGPKAGAIGCFTAGRGAFDPSPPVGG